MAYNEQKTGSVNKSETSNNFQEESFHSEESTQQWKGRAGQSQMSAAHGARVAASQEGTKKWMLN